MVGSPSRWTVRGRESIPEVREGLGGPSEGPGEVGKPTWRPGRIPEDDPVVREAHLKGWEGREANPEVREVLGGPSKGPGEAGKPTWRAGRGPEAHLKVQKAHPDVWEGSGGQPRVQRGVRESILEDRDGAGVHSEG